MQQSAPLGSSAHQGCTRRASERLQWHHTKTLAVHFSPFLYVFFSPLFCHVTSTSEMHLLSPPPDPTVLCEQSAITQKILLSVERRPSALVGRNGAILPLCH